MLLPFLTLALVLKLDFCAAVFLPTVDGNSSSISGTVVRIQGNVTVKRSRGGTAPTLRLFNQFRSDSREISGRRRQFQEVPFPSVPQQPPYPIGPLPLSYPIGPVQPIPAAQNCTCCCQMNCPLPLCPACPPCPQCPSCPEQAKTEATSSQTTQPPEPSAHTEPPTVAPQTTNTTISPTETPTNATDEATKETTTPTQTQTPVDWRKFPPSANCCQVLILACACAVCPCGQQNGTSYPVPPNSPQQQLFSSMFRVTVDHFVDPKQVHSSPNGNEILAGKFGHSHSSTERIEHRESINTLKQPTPSAGRSERLNGATAQLSALIVLMVAFI